MELIIVVAIMATLATLVLPSLTGHSEKAHMAEAMNMLGAMRRAEASHFDENGSYLAIRDSCWDMAQAQTDYDRVGMIAPACSGTHFWQYVAWNFPFNWTVGGCTFPAGTVCAMRTVYRPPPGVAIIATVNRIMLRPNGNWCGTGIYARGQRFDLARLVDNVSAA